MDQIESMRMFVRVVELGGFTAAADDLGLLKTSVSNAIRQLEGRLGARLLHRTTRKVQVTQDGQIFYERCKDLLADIEELHAMVGGRGATDLRGRLRVDLPLAAARDIVIPRLPAFLQRHPGLELELSSTDRRVDIVREGFDCVLRVGAVGEQNVVAVPLGELQQINCASREYLAARGVPRNLNDLAGHRLVGYAQTLGSRPGGFEYVPSAGAAPVFVPMHCAVTVNNSDAYHQACHAGLGIVQLPGYGIRQHLADGRLVEILPAYRAAPLPVSLIYASRRHQPARVRVFIDWLREVLTQSLGLRQP
ncbi:MAG: LysR family transcriptional regulator [Zoogloeaceae bacterium]|nr:LysR family transcriptional regulator [Zoogloeaceae bacterium]